MERRAQNGASADGLICLGYNEWLLYPISVQGGVVEQRK